MVWTVWKDDFNTVGRRLDHVQDRDGQRQADYAFWIVCGPEGFLFVVGAKRLPNGGENMGFKIAVIGAGSVGTGVAVLLQRQGYQVVGVASRTPESAARAAERLRCPVGSPAEVARPAEVVFITTSDTAIGEVAKELARHRAVGREHTVVHMSGSLTTDVLQPVADLGAKVVSIHPLQSCASAERAITNLPGSVFSIQGDRETYPVAEQIVKDLGGEAFHIDREAKVLYHAAAAVASNYLVALLDLSQKLMQATGMPERLFLPALLPLVKGTLANVEEIGIPKALTGPISRGDVITISDHLHSMGEACPQLIPLYVALGRHTIEVALRKGTLDRRKAALLEDLLHRYEKQYEIAECRRAEAVDTASTN